jgi:tRNA (adenine22-N1)-methyltransferase
MTAILLDPRLAAAESFVRQGSVAADIGSDHSYLACRLAQSGRCPLCYACDIAQGPLERTRHTVLRYGLQGKVTPLLSDGLAGLREKQIDDIVIAGMGGELIAGILAAAPWAWDEKKRFVLQPMTKAERLRIWLYRNGFVIEEETAAQSGRFAYTVISARYSGISREIDKKFAWCGKLWGKKDEAARRYLGQVAANLRKIAAGRKDSGLARIAGELEEGQRDDGE